MRKKRRIGSGGVLELEGTNQLMVKQMEWARNCESNLEAVVGEAKSNKINVKIYQVGQ